MYFFLRTYIHGGRKRKKNELEKELLVAPAFYMRRAQNHVTLHTRASEEEWVEREIRSEMKGEQNEKMEYKK